MPKKSKTENAIAMLKEDHTEVKALFNEFEKASTTISTKQEIAADALMKLKIHASIEESLFYPALRQEMEDEEGLMDEADEEHHVAKILIAELEQMSGNEEHWEAKFKVLAESVRHHIKEEEGEIFPQARKTNIDFAALGEQMSNLKESLRNNGIPPDAETRMIADQGLRGESPSRQAQQRIKVPLKAA
jgi:hemerythrin-like domain-containing protein